MANPLTKFGRNYELVVQGSDGQTITIKLPFTIEFDITRNTLTSANVCQVRVYNLNKENRNRIRFNITNFGGPYHSISLKAGYGKNLAEIFTGNISQAWSVREGTNFITQIECFDGGFAFVNSRTDRYFPAGTPQKVVIGTIATDLKNVKVGAVGSFPGNISQAASYSGNTPAILNELSGGGFFVDKGRAYVLGTNEYYRTPGSTLVINSESGLLNTPVLEQSTVRFDMLFEPSLNVGTMVMLQSATEENFNGTYKVTAVKHRGVISDAVSGNCITSGEFFYNKLLTPVG